MADLPMKEQLRRGFKDMGARSYSSAKNFALVGAIFSGTECCIEGVGTLTHPSRRDVMLMCSLYSFELRTISPMASLQGVSPEERLVPVPGPKPLPSAVLASRRSVRRLITTCGCRLTEVV
jgi:hypothetical protein